MFKTILAATDMITRADAPVTGAIDLAAQYGASLSILHVLESAFRDNRKRVVHFETGNEVMVDPDYCGAVKRALKKTYAPRVSGLDRVNFIVRSGFPWEAILNAAREQETDLIVLGPHSGQAEKKGVVRVAGKIGSTVEGVVTRENCPVMIINTPLTETQLQFKKIVVGIDFSVSCECALCFSVRMAQSFNSRLYPFFMIPVPPYPKYSELSFKQDMEVFTRRLEDFCHTYLDGTEHEYMIWAGALPHQEILACAKKVNADLIILGSHTKAEDGKWYTGSVVEKVSYRSDCPILTVTDPSVLDKWQDIHLYEADPAHPLDRSIHLFHDREKKQTCPH